MSQSRRVALALGSGGARGFAHIGVVQVLEERGYEVAAVAGSSMGALVGGVMAAGRLKEFTDWAVGLKQRDVLRLLDPAWAAPGALAADRLINHLNEFLTDTEIENLPIPYTAVATDLTSRREVWFQKGQLRSAIRASIAIPGLITPVVIDGRLLADGGLLNPVPIEPTAAAGADLTVAVSLQAPRPPHEPAGPVRATAEASRAASMMLIRRGNGLGPGCWCRSTAPTSRASASGSGVRRSSQAACCGRPAGVVHTTTG